MPINCIFKKKNVDKTQRNGLTPESKTIVKYITQTGMNGAPGLDAFQVYISPQSKIFNSGPASQSDTVNVYAFRGTAQLGTYVDESAFSSLPSGLTCTVNDNSTNQTTVTITATNALNEDGGTIVIPVRYPTDTYDSSSSYDASLWDASLHDFADVSTYYSWTLVKPTTSAWNLDLTNENASINADKDGSIYGNATRPTCTAKLTRGTEDVSTAVYYIDTEASIYSSKNPQDVSINPSSGVMTFGSGFTFTGLGLEIPIYAKVDNVEKARKIMNVTKSLPGADGISRSYWLDLSADAIKVDTADVCHPDTISVSVWKQENESNPVTTTECVVKWCYNSTDASLDASTYTSAITVDASKDYMTFKLYKDSSYMGESETVPILKDGKNGVGQVGPAGPVIRGPILWDSSMESRRFCAGSGNMATDSSYIDIVYYDPSGGVNYHYYRCTESHNFSTGDSWPGSPEWTQAEGEYDFIATQLLLANNAKIKFLTNNEFYLTDASGNIHGGGRAATADSSVIFWAGSAEGSTNINAAPFQVDIDGNIRATSGTFAGYCQFPYTFVSDLQPDEYLYYSSVGYKYVSQTTWKGRLSSAPSSPSTGWCYYNTSDNKYYYYYSGSWRQMTDQNSSRGYIADNRAYLVSDSTNTSAGSYEASYFLLPNPSADWNGFTYKIIVEPRLTRSEGSQYLHIYTANNSTIYVYAFSQLRMDTEVELQGGEFTITCMPKHSNYSVEYAWAITNATGGIYLPNNGTSGTFICNAIGSCYDGDYPIYEIVSYGSSRPTVSNTNNTIFVSRS